MNTPSEEPTRNAQVTRETELAQAQSSLHEELTESRARLPQGPAGEEQARAQARTRPRRSNRRKLLTKGLGMAAAASVGTGALLELSSGTVVAAPTPKPGVFASNTAGTPAVSATGTNGADGVDASSDSGTGVLATSSSGTALVATSSTGLAGHFMGNVQMDNNLTVTGTLSSGAIGFASSTTGTPAVKATGTNGADGIDASSDSGTGVSAKSGSGTALVATSSSGLAGHFVGNVQMDNNLNVAGTLTGAVSAFASSVSGTPAVTASGTNKADGVFGSSDAGVGVQGNSTSTSGGIGVQGSSTTNPIGPSTSGATGVLGICDFGPGVTGTSNFVGVLGTSSFNGAAGAGVQGGDGTGNATGVLGTSNGGPGVVGQSRSGTGVAGDGDTNGVHGTSSHGNGILGQSFIADLLHAGIHGIGVLAGLFDGNVQVNGTFSGTGTDSSGNSPGGTGVQGTGGTGVLSAFSTGLPGTGVLGTGGTSTGTGSTGGTGVHGIGGTSTGFGGRTGLAGLFDGDVQVNGNFSATGSKNFVQAHPSDPSREIVYVALEGGEAGTYVRGTGQLQGGKAVLALPEHFGLVTATEGLTVQLTPRGEWLQLYVAELDTAQLVVREAQGKSGAFDYFIGGVRRGYEQHEVIRMKH